MEYLIFESAVGYTLFEKLECETVGLQDENFQKSIQDRSLFKKMVTLHAFQGFSSSQEALSNMNDLNSKKLPSLLVNFLENSLPRKAKKSKKILLGVDDKDLAVLLEEVGYTTAYNKVNKELLRGCRQHYTKLASDISKTDMKNAQLGLGHSFTRNKLQVDPSRADKPILNGIALLDSLDKNINLFAMRVKEWYSWHFPELQKIVSDSYAFCRCAQVIQDKSTFDEKDPEKLAALNKATGAEEVTQEILRAMRMSMGQDVLDIDIENMLNFCVQVVNLGEYRAQISDYLHNKLDMVCPNLAAVVGDLVSARLVSQAGGLSNLAKCPASTIQILGAEKALFRALKKKGNTPKYGLIFHSSAISRAEKKNKGRISRFLANKCSLASKIDCYSEIPDYQAFKDLQKAELVPSNLFNSYGLDLKQQVEDRLQYLAEDKQPDKNTDVMEQSVAQAEKLWKKARKALVKSKKRSLEEETEVEPAKKCKTAA